MLVFKYNYYFSQSFTRKMTKQYFWNGFYFYFFFKGGMGLF